MGVPVGYDAEHVVSRPCRPTMGRGHAVLFAAVAALYVGVVVAVLTGSALVHLDWRLALWKPYERWPEVHGFLDSFVVAGQRAPSALAALLWLGGRALRYGGGLRPLLLFLIALGLLNVTVGAVKLGTGRLGPRYTDAVGSAEVFSGGDIFPSGHTANAVVTWGALAYLATPRYRRAGAVAAGMVALAVGLTTVYLGTHWFSDALGGWAAGALVLLALPLFEPFVANTEWRLAHRGPGRHEQGVRARRRPYALPVAAAVRGPDRLLVPRGRLPIRFATRDARAPPTIAGLLPGAHC